MVVKGVTVVVTTVLGGVGGEMMVGKVGGSGGCACSLHVSMFKYGFLDSGGGIGTKKKSNVPGNTATVGSTSQVVEVNDVVSSGNPDATSALDNDSFYWLDANCATLMMTLTFWLPFGFGFNEFSSTEGVDSVITDGPWMIHGVSIFLNKWSSSVSLLKEEWSRVPV
ncbi:hypothetical protein Tco_0196669 [Tanacetum coccineum]